MKEKFWGEFFYVKSEQRSTYRIWSEATVADIKNFQNDVHPFYIAPNFSKGLLEMNLFEENGEVKFEFGYQATDITMEHYGWGMKINFHKLPWVVTEVTDNQQAAEHNVKVNWKIRKWNSKRITDENVETIYAQFTLETPGTITFDTGNQPLMPVFN